MKYKIFVHWLEKSFIINLKVPGKIVIQKKL